MGGQPHSGRGKGRTVVGRCRGKATPPQGPKCIISCRTPWLHLTTALLATSTILPAGNFCQEPTLGCRPRWLGPVRTQRARAARPQQHWGQAGGNTLQPHHLPHHISEWNRLEVALPAHPHAWLQAQVAGGQCARSARELQGCSSTGGRLGAPPSSHTISTPSPPPHFRVEQGGGGAHSSPTRLAAGPGGWGPVRTQRARAARPQQHWGQAGGTTKQPHHLLHHLFHHI